MTASLITLTTDFGTRDWFVGTMKGVILGIAPRARLIDLTHEIAPGDIAAGAFALSVSCSYFPPGTIHLAVIDPGVGSERPAVAIQTDQGFYVGPDNGLFSRVLAGQRIRAVHCLTNPRYQLADVSRTFHGRDIFATAAAYLAKGVKIKQLGSVYAAPLQEIDSARTGPEITQKKNGCQIVGRIQYIDRFGNAITNIRPAHWPEEAVVREIRVGRRLLRGLQSSYAAVPPGHPLAILGSTGYVEIAVNGGSAAQQFSLKVGDPVRVLAVTAG